MKAQQNKTTKSITSTFQIGDHVIGSTPDDKSINGFVTALTSLGVYVTDGVKTKFDQLKVEASEFFNVQVCRIRKA